MAAQQLRQGVNSGERQVAGSAGRKPGAQCPQRRAENGSVGNTGPKGLLEMISPVLWPGPEGCGGLGTCRLVVLLRSLVALHEPTPSSSEAAWLPLQPLPAKPVQAFTSQLLFS